MAFGEREKMLDGFQEGGRIYICAEREKCSLLHLRQIIAPDTPCKLFSEQLNMKALQNLKMNCGERLLTKRRYALRFANNSAFH